MGFDPLFGRVSFEKAAKFIAIFDLVICCLYILSHFAGGGYVYEDREEEYETKLSDSLKKEDVFHKHFEAFKNHNHSHHFKVNEEYQKTINTTSSNANSSSGGSYNSTHYYYEHEHPHPPLTAIHPLLMHAFGKAISEESSSENHAKIDETTTTPPPSFHFPSHGIDASTPQQSTRNVLTYDDYQKLVGMELPSMDILVILLLCFLVMAIAHVIMEVWMCRLLLKAATHKDGSALKLWFWCRVGVTLILTLFSLIGILSVRTDWIDWVFMVMNIYRFYSIYVVYEFKAHVSACNAIAKPIEL